MGLSSWLWGGLGRKPLSPWWWLSLGDAMVSPQGSSPDFGDCEPRGERLVLLFVSYKAFKPPSQTQTGILKAP